MPGLYFEEFEPGMVIDHEVRRTVTETDNVLFSAMTLNMAPLHLDAEYSKDSIFGQRLVNSLFVLGLVSGISMQDTTFGTTLGNLGFNSSRSPSPFFTGTRSACARRSWPSASPRAVRTPAL
jgi:acyl dehydratase